MKKIPFAVWMISGLLALSLGGCGGDKQEEAAPAPANTLQDATGAVSYYSPEGHFHIVWPSGCARVRLQTWAIENPDNPDSLGRAKIFCDRDNFENEGCAVGIQFLSQLPGKPEATPEKVIEAVTAGLQSFEIEILRQSPITRAGFEGVGVLGVSAGGGDGTFWTEGFIVNGDIFVLSAWSAGRSIFELEEIRNFFASFEPDK